MNANPETLLSARQLSRMLGRSETFLGSRIEAGEIQPDVVVELGAGRSPLPAFRRERFAELQALVAAGRLPSVPQPPRLAA
jgi:hypothetical protein